LRLAKAEAGDQVADGARSAAKELDDVEAVGLSEGAKSCDHGKG
jgi:hypothetical protein